MNERATFALVRDTVLAVFALLAMFLVYKVAVEAANPSMSDPGDFVLTTTRGKVITGDAHETMVLHFWTEGCGYCKRQIPEFNQYQGVPLYGVNVDRLDARELEQTMKRVGMRYPSASGGYLAGRMGVSVYPTTVVLKNGEVAASRTGAFSVGDLENLVGSAW